MSNLQNAIDCIWYLKRRERMTVTGTPYVALLQGFQSMSFKTTLYKRKDFRPKFKQFGHKYQ
jgi:hypothetical protein